MVMEQLDTNMQKKKKQGGGDFPGGPGVKNPPANAGDTGSSCDVGRYHMPTATEPMF